MKRVNTVAAFVLGLLVSCCLSLPLGDLQVAGSINVINVDDGPGNANLDSGEYGDLYEGDIMLPKKRNGHPSNRNRWPSGVVPYVIDGSVGSKGRGVLQNAFNYYKQHTCIRLVPRTNQNDYIVFKTPASGCNSYVGKIGGAQTVNLATGCFGSLGTTLHEIMHAIGFYHEMGREDRDNYINILWDNIQDKYKYAFNVHKGSLTYGTKYDISSVMHYSSKAFSKNGQYTITPKAGVGTTSQLGQRSKLTDTDLKKVQAMYQCSGTTVTVTKTAGGRLGCFVDASERHLPLSTWKDPAMTPQKCTNHCRQKGFSYAGLEYKTECFCGNAYGRYNKVGDSDCNSLCGGDKSKTCGGFWRIEIYEVQPVRLGCYQDASTRHLPNNRKDDDQMMRPFTCAVHCKEAGYKYAGVENSSECFCGNSVNASLKKTDNECNKKCTGDVSLTCGGSWRIEIFKI